MAHDTPPPSQGLAGTPDDPIWKWISDRAAAERAAAAEATRPRIAPAPKPAAADNSAALWEEAIRIGAKRQVNAAIKAVFKRLAEVLPEVIDARIAKATEPLLARIAELETRGLEFCGVHQRAIGYRRGSCVSHQGGLWIALRSIEPGETPGAADGWQLAVRAGRDAR